MHKASIIKSKDTTLLNLITVYSFKSCLNKVQRYLECCKNRKTNQDSYKNEKLNDRKMLL